jgi:hypothetical protein
LGFYFPAQDESLSALQEIVSLISPHNVIVLKNASAGTKIVNLLISPDCFRSQFKSLNIGCFVLSFVPHALNASRVNNIVKNDYLLS